MLHTHTHTHTLTYPSQWRWVGALARHRGGREATSPVCPAESQRHSDNLGPAVESASSQGGR